MKQVAYTKAALRTLGKIPANMAQRIRNKVAEYASDPASQANNVKRLQGRTAVRLRVGDWRIIMEDGVVLEVLEIGARGSVYD